ncbi:MAG: hypothetical protein M1269_00280 [Chloroflexi bacterium]|nr:hypothetical protein [Chloroflexota bacterium]
MNILNVVDGVHLGGLHLVPRKDVPGYWQLELDSLNVVKGKRSLIVFNRLELGIPLDGFGKDISSCEEISGEKSTDKSKDKKKGRRGQPAASDTDVKQAAPSSAEAETAEKCEEKPQPAGTEENTGSEASATVEDKEPGQEKPGGAAIAEKETECSDEKSEEEKAACEPESEEKKDLKAISEFFLDGFDVILYEELIKRLIMSFAHILGQEGVHDLKAEIAPGRFNVSGHIKKSFINLPFEFSLEPTVNKGRLEILPSRMSLLHFIPIPQFIIGVFMSMIQKEIPEEVFSICKSRLVFDFSKISHIPGTVLYAIETGQGFVRLEGGREDC